MGEAIRPDLPDQVTDTAGLGPRVTFIEVGAFALIADRGEATDVTGIPDAVPAPTAEQLNDTPLPAKPNRTLDEARAQRAQRMKSVIGARQALRQIVSRRSSLPNRDK